VGFWPNVEDLRANWRQDQAWQPQMAVAQREQQYHYWQKAVTRTFDWVE